MDSALSLRKTTSTTKFKIEQKVPSCPKKRGPYVVERDLNPNDVVIKRRFGEGAKPIFERDDISINQNSSNLEDCSVNASTRDELRRASGYNSENGNSLDRFQKNTSSPNAINTKGTHQAYGKQICYSSNVNQEKLRFKRSCRHSSEDSISPERDRRNLIHPPNSTRNSHVSSKMLHQNQDVEVSSLRNASREKDRASQSSKHSFVNTTSLSGHRRINIDSLHCQSTSSKTPRLSQKEDIPYFSNPQREKDRLRRMYGTSDPRKKIHASKSRSPPLAYNSKHRISSKKKYETPLRGSRSRRSTSNESRYYSSRSPRRTSQSKSPRRQNQNRNHNPVHITAPLAATQIITIPVPMSEYPYVFPTWRQPAWGAPIPHGAPQRFTTYTLPPAVFPDIRTSYGMPRPHNFRMFQHQHRYHPLNFGPRLPKGNRHKD